MASSIVGPWNQSAPKLASHEGVAPTGGCSFRRYARQAALFKRGRDLVPDIMANIMADIMGVHEQHEGPLTLPAAGSLARGLRNAKLPFPWLSTCSWSLLLVLSACGDNDEPSGGEPPPVRGRSVQAAPAENRKSPNNAQARKATQENELNAELAKEAAEIEAARKRLAQEANDAPGRAATNEQAKPPKRDFARELNQAIGSPLTCLRSRTAKGAAQNIHIAVTAVVMGSGAVSRADVSSATLDETERACVKRAAERARIRGPIDAAPLHISTTFTLEQAPTPKP